MIDYLTGDTSGALILRHNFIFKIVPMLNPDGVINGNTRVNLAGTLCSPRTTKIQFIMIIIMITLSIQLV
jgi:hypothetical protein